MVSPHARLGAVADALSVAAFGVAAAGLVWRQPVPQAILATFVCALCAVLLLLLLRTERRDGRRVRQSLAFATYGTAAVTVARETHALVTGGSATAFTRGLEAALRQLADAYGTTVGMPCRATVKLVHQPVPRRSPGDLAVRTVCRSAPTVRRDDGVDWIDANTDFARLLRQSADHFFCNDVVAALADGYRNSHFTDEVVARREFPYRATIVWPVRAPEQHDPDRWDVIGFLCLDAQHVGVFTPDVDIAPGAAFAELLYPALLVYRSLYDDTEGGST